MKHSSALCSIWKLPILRDHSETFCLPHFFLDKREAPVVYYSSIRQARVVELADSLDSGSSVHSGRAGSSPASRTLEKSFRKYVF